MRTIVIPRPGPRLGPLLGLGLGLVALACASSALADLKTEIQAHSGDTAVLVPVQTPSNDDYGLLLMPPEDFSNRLGLSNGRLENSNFKIVAFDVSPSGTLGDEALPVTDFDGDNVMYHLVLAREYYAKLSSQNGQMTGLTNPALDRKITVRVRAYRKYNLVTHVAEYSKFNNAAYFPANYAGKWGQEIWFQSRKRGLKGLNWYQLALDGGLALAAGSWEIAAANAPTEFLARYNGGLDAAKQPDVIYHEAFHYATDTPALFPAASEGNPVAEDYANYFGSSLAGRPEVAEIGEFSSRYFKRDYRHVHEVTNTDPVDDGYNSLSFGPSVFWQIRKWLGQERADQLIWNSLSFLAGSSHHRDVPAAVLSAAHQDSSLTTNELAQIEGLFLKYAKSFANIELKFHPAVASAIDPAIENNAKLRDQGVLEAQAIRRIPGELDAEGVALSDDDQAELDDAADTLEAETTRPGFGDKVRSALGKVGHALARGAIDAGKAVGYAGSAVAGASEIPIVFGTDLTTGLVLGHGLISEREQDVVSELLGAGGGVASIYYAYTGLAAAGITWASPLTASAEGVVYVNHFLCRKAHARGKTERDRYCAATAKLMRVIEGDGAKAGETTALRIRRKTVKIADYLAKPFRSAD